MSTPRCPCGGETFVDQFDWPRWPTQYYLRCAACDRISAGTAPTEKDAEALRIEPERAAA